MEVPVTHVSSSHALAVRVQAWEEQDRQLREAVASGTCPECGAPLAAAGGCLECPCCGWAACS